VPTSANPQAAYLVAQQLLTCALDKVEATWVDEPEWNLQRACVVWGEIAWDNCECGQLVVSIGRQFPSNEFPFDAGTGIGTGVGVVSRQSRCGSPIWIIEYEISILRCAPIQDEQGDPPPCADLDESARRLAIDAWAVRTGIGCCLAELKTELEANGAPSIHEYLIREQIATGPAGGCAGSSLMVSVGLRNCFCPKDQAGSS
jgi:hypothetical protein